MTRNEEIEKALKEHKTTHNSIYADIGIALEKFNTEELATYYLEKFGDYCLRDFLEQQIIADKINKLTVY